MGAVGNGRLKFGEFELDSRSGKLFRDGRPVKIQAQPLRVLGILLERHGEIVSREQLRARIWGDATFVEFDQGLNYAIRQIRLALHDEVSEPRYIETLPKQGYRFVAGIVDAEPKSPAEPSAADPLAASLGGSRPKPDPAPSSARPYRLIWLALAGCVAVVLPALGWFVTHRHLATESIRSLAVIPLDNLSGDPDQEYFADGMTDELITMLAKDSTLRITSRISVMQYKKAHRPLREIASELGVDSILEGSIARTGNQVHMTIQLIQAPADTHVWAESYDRDAHDIVSLPREAAEAIAKRLDKAVPQTAGPRYVNPEAHDAYLRGRYLSFRGQSDQAGKYFRKAVDLQPDYALGWAGLSSYYAEGAADGIMDPLRAGPEGEADARKAVDLDNESSEAHLTLGGSILVSRWDATHALEEISRAIELDPRNTQAIHLRARILSLLGRYQEAIQTQKTATEIDPFERPWAMVTILDEAREYDAAIEEARQRLQADPSASMYELVALAYRGKGMPTEWAQAYEKHFQLAGDPDSAAAVEHAFRRGGQKAVVQWQLDQLERKSKTSYVSPVALALLHAQLGDSEKTLALLEAGYREHSPLLLWIQLDPAYDFLHADERYRSIIKRAGLPPSY
jgi:TolB-like protein/DNA-binding winged helix-turn-helix (wHTH) protein